MKKLLKKSLGIIVLSTATALLSCSAAFAVSDSDLVNGASSSTVEDEDLAYYNVTWSYNDGVLDVIEGEDPDEDYCVSNWLGSFDNCEKVTTLKMKCKNLDDPLKSSFPNLKEIDFDPSLEKLDTNAPIFKELKNLYSVDLGKTSIKSIKGGIFSASYIKSITLPKGLTTLGENALADCGQSAGSGTYGSAEGGGLGDRRPLDRDEYRAELLHGSQGP